MRRDACEDTMSCRMKYTDRRYCIPDHSLVLVKVMRLHTETSIGRLASYLPIGPLADFATGAP